MTAQLGLDDVRRAWDTRDPELVETIRKLTQQVPPEPESPHREGALTFEKFLQEIFSPAFRKKPPEEQAHYRLETLKALESADAEVPLSDKLRLHEILMVLWEDNGVFARSCLLQIIASVPLVYGPWKALKRIFKEAEEKGDTEIYGALAARFDMAFAGFGRPEVSTRTLGYLVRRAWRFLRRTGQTLPAVYADHCVDVLSRYSADFHSGYWPRCWILNHILYHETGSYAAQRFHYRSRPKSLTKQRAFAELWQRTPRPLFSLLERAQADDIREFAIEGLKTDFRATLREVEPEWVARLVSVNSRVVDEFVVWILKNVPKFEQAAFRDLGLHEAVLRLFDSQSNDARAYAADYARTHARDLPVEQLIRLTNNDNAQVYKLALDLIGSRDPRKEIGLDNWGKLLETEHGSELAQTMIRKHFGAKELTPDWFRERLLGDNDQSQEYARNLLPDVHPTKKLGPEFFIGVVDWVDASRTSYWQVRDLISFAMNELQKFEVNELPADFLRRSLLNNFVSRHITNWIDEGKLKAETIGVDWLKTLAYHPSFETSAEIAELRKADFPWVKQGGVNFDESLSEEILDWLGDVRRFSPDQLGFEWLMELVKRSESRYHDFATETMIKAFLPPDFAPKETAPEPAEKTKKKKDKSEKPAVDLKGESYLFTGKLATMTRSEAQKKVREAGGKVGSAVNKNLNFLVIGDEGSPLYGQGRKGSKQTKAESLIAEGADLKIISETAFLQMLAGEQREFSEDAVQVGCENLWNMLTSEGKADEPLRQFALQYFRRHHPEICLAETDRPVDPGAEIPPEFLTFERVKPLFFERRHPLRAYALELAHYEFNRWAPPMEGIIELCESPYDEVRQFIAKAMTAEDTTEHRRYRIDPEVLTADAVYSFCESRDEGTRALGMELIERHPRLKLPEELFRLTESPDRRVRAFVIRSFWSLYRERGITSDWKPTPPPERQIKSKKKTAPKPIEELVGPGAPAKPDNLPAEADALKRFLRRMLFELPPGRPPEKRGEAGTIQARLKPLPHRKAKLALIETLRDTAVEDGEFAGFLLPLLMEFQASHGPSEQAACLVAVTRIRHFHPEWAPEESDELLV